MNKALIFLIDSDWDKIELGYEAMHAAGSWSIMVFIKNDQLQTWMASYLSC